MIKFNEVFPNNSVLGSYNPLSQVIVYNDMTRAQFEATIKDPLDPENVNSAALIAHETSHFIDHMSTLSGQKFLLHIFNAWNAITNREENEYWHVVKLQRTILKTKYEEYYKEYGDNYYITSKGYKGWTFRSTFGARFDADGKVDFNRPIIFSQFKHQGQFVGRIPLSLESLWETNAVASEIHLHKTSIALMEDQSQAIVSDELVNKKYTDWLYDPNMLTYSIAAQLVSSLIGYADLHTAFMVSKSISSIALNLPETYYRRIKIPGSIGLPRERIKGLQNSEDPSCIFYLMVLNLQEAGEDIIGADMFVDTEKVLRINGLPKKGILERDIKREMSLLKRSAIEGENKDLYLFFHKLGIELFDNIGIDSAPLTLAYTKYAENTLNLCGFECIDEENANVIRHEDFEGLYSKLINILKACGY